MSINLFCLIQNILPQTLLSKLIGKIAHCKIIWVKNLFINIFCFFYKIEWQEAIRKQAKEYESFNDFFTRQLEPQARPFTPNSQHILSPADGCIAAYGKIDKKLILQAKNRFFSLDDLLVQDTHMINCFSQGMYTTIYLAPHNYHRVHMPISGKLIKTIHVAGRLFSVNQTTSEHVPNLYAKNERIICLFETPLGKMAIILVGAMIVGNIQLAWQPISPHPHNTHVLPNQPISLNQGDEVGYFKLGSTVVLLLESPNLSLATSISMNGAIKTNALLAQEKKYNLS